ncbi:MAG: PLP-dependent aminotransferase family protein [Alphaproteobacteria bacterium]|nr:PLP-dependent aminotransferase family protein [Alphaproteobacteria bacterium]
MNEDWIAEDALSGGADRPKYILLADKIAEAVDRGGLKPGDRLPTHRALSWRLGCTVGTVTRAYAEAQRRGLIDAAVGRGSFVADPDARLGGSAEPAAPGPVGLGELPERNLVGVWHEASVLGIDQEADSDPLIRLNSDFPPLGAEVEALKETLPRLATSPMLAQMLMYQPHCGHRRHRGTGALWAKRRGIQADPDRIVVTLGGNNGILASLSAITRPGDTVAVEALGYPAIKPIASLLGLHFAPVAVDEEGLVPDALDIALATQKIAALYTTPTLQNPTNVTMSEHRRRAVAAVLERHGVPVVEDDVYGPLPEDAPPALCAFLSPELGYYTTSISKALAPGLRVGYAVGPGGATNRIAGAMRSSNWMASPLTAEIASEWIESGVADAILQSHRTEMAARRRLVLDRLPMVDHALPDGALHTWFQLPPDWRIGAFVVEARQVGIVLPPTDSFMMAGGETPHMVRLSFCQPRSRDTLAAALDRLAVLIEDRSLGVAPDVI